MSAPLPVLILKTGHYPIHHGGLGIIRSLGRMGIPVYTVAEDHAIPASTSRYLTGSFVWNAGDLPKAQMLDALARIGGTLDKPTVLIPTDDLGAILIAEASATLRRSFLFPNISPGIPRALANKQTLYTLCRQIGVPCPNTRCLTSISDANEFAETAIFPIVAKAAAGWLNPRFNVSIVRSKQELLDIWSWAASAQTPNLLVQEYIPHGEDWFFHGYCDDASCCLAGFTGMKLRSFPPHSGMTTLGRSVSNDVLFHQTETFLKAISYAGIMDLDYRFDKRDQKYKLLDFNPRIGAQFRLFVDDNGLDVARVLYRDLTGQVVRHSRQVDGRVFVVEPDDLRASLGYFRRGELSASAWIYSFKGHKEFAWFDWRDPLPFLLVLSRLAIRRLRKLIQIGPFKSSDAWWPAGIDQGRKSDRTTPQHGLWPRLSSIATSMRHGLARQRH